MTDLSQRQPVRHMESTDAHSGFTFDLNANCLLRRSNCTPQKSSHRRFRLGRVFHLALNALSSHCAELASPASQQYMGSVSKRADAIIAPTQNVLLDNRQRAIWSEEPVLCVSQRGGAPTSEIGECRLESSAEHRAQRELQLEMRALCQANLPAVSITQRHGTV